MRRTIATLSTAAAIAVAAVALTPATAAAAWDICTSGQRLTPTQRAMCGISGDPAPRPTAKPSYTPRSLFSVPCQSRRPALRYVTTREWCRAEGIVRARIVYVR